MHTPTADPAAGLELRYYTYILLYYSTTVLLYFFTTFLRYCKYFFTAAEAAHAPELRGTTDYDAGAFTHPLPHSLRQGRLLQLPSPIFGYRTEAKFSAEARYDTDTIL